MKSDKGGFYNFPFFSTIYRININNIIYKKQKVIIAMAYISEEK
jgi:hypothetical protein